MAMAEVALATVLSRSVPAITASDKKNNRSALPIAQCGQGCQNRLTTFQGLRTARLPIRIGQSLNTTLKQEVNKAVESPSSSIGQGHRAVIVCNGMNIVFVSAEVAPWSKTGGLGDVLGGLPPALAARGHRVMTVSPRYDQYKDAWDTDKSEQITVGDRTETVRFFHTYKRGVDHVFLDHPFFLAKVWGKTGGKIYGPTSGLDYEDNQFRFSLLAKAMEFLLECCDTGGMTTKERFLTFLSAFQKVSRNLVKKQLTWFHYGDHNEVHLFHWVDASQPLMAWEVQ